MNTLLHTQNERQAGIASDYVLAPEEVIQEFHDGSDLLATITRNHYGALVINTSCVMFVDVDLTPRSDGARQVPQASDLLAQVNRMPTIQRLRSKELLRRFQDVAQANPKLGSRIYRTAAGFRVLITDRQHGVPEPETQKLFSALGADPAYAAFCRKQERFRARVSPKPWRVGMHTPYRDSDNQHGWRYCYEIQAAGHGVCEYVTSHGNPRICDTAQAIIEIHDCLTIRDGAMLA